MHRGITLISFSAIFSLQSDAGYEEVKGGSEKTCSGVKFEEGVSSELRLGLRPRVRMMTAQVMGELFYMGDIITVTKNSKNKIIVLILISFLLFSFTSISSAETLVSGTISTNTTLDLAGSPYMVNGNVYVYNTTMTPTLTIEPGIEVALAYLLLAARVSDGKGGVGI